MGDTEGYWLGVDLGTCVTSAVVRDANSTAMLSLGRDGHDMPSVVAVTEDGVLVGDAAHRRARTDPASVAREFKRRMGDTTPLLVGGRWVQPEWLTAQLLDHVLTSAHEQHGAGPDGVTLSYPATWGDYRRELLIESAMLAGLDSVDLVAEPVAAARFAAAGERLGPGHLAVIFDLGGGTFDTALVRRVGANDFEVVGRAIGLDRLGGVDLDQALFGHVLRSLELDLSELPESPVVLSAVAQLRDDIVGAKEQLSFDTSAVLPVMIEGHQTQLRLTRLEFEHLARPFVDKAIDTVEEAVEAAGVDPEEVDVIVPVGGTSRVPLVAERLAHRLGIPIASAANPRHSVALGTVAFSPGHLDEPVAHAASSLAEPAVADAGSAADPVQEPIEAQLSSFGEAPGEAPAPPSAPADAVDAAPVSLQTTTVVDRPSRLLWIGAVVAMVVLAIGLWQFLGDRSTDEDIAAAGESVTSFGQAADDAASETGSAPASQDPATGLPALPSEGFEVGVALGSSPPMRPMTDSGPPGLPQRLWQNQFSGLQQGPIGGAGVLVVSDAQLTEAAFVSRVVGIDPRTGATQWSHEAVDGVIQRYFVADASVVVLTMREGAGADGSSGERLYATQLDLATGEARAQLDITPSSVDIAITQMLAAVVHSDVLVTSWHDGEAELLSSAFDLAGARQLWEARDPAPEMLYDAAADGEVHVAFGDELLVARDLRSGERLWSRTDLSWFAIKAVGGGVLVIDETRGRAEYKALDLLTGEERWTVNERPNAIFVADQDHLYAALTGSGEVNSVVLADGSPRWDEWVTDRGRSLDLLRAGGDRLYLIDENGNLIAYDSRNGDVIWRTTIDEIDFGVRLATAGDVLFVQIGESITAYG